MTHFPTALVPAARRAVPFMPRSGVVTDTPRPPARTTTGLLRRDVRAARHDPAAFLELCCATPDGRAVRQAAVHRALQRFLSDHRKALVELPRDHGKSTQVCGRVVWELGLRPGLRVKLVCATDQLAADRSRYLRNAIADNPRVRDVFPELVRGSRRRPRRSPSPARPR